MAFPASQLETHTNAITINHGSVEESKAMKIQRNPDKDELQPPLFDLIRTDKVQLFRSLLHRLHALGLTEKTALFKFTAATGSTAMIDLCEEAIITMKLEILNGWPYAGFLAAIHGNNVGNFRHLLHVYRSRIAKILYSDILLAILESKVEDFRSGWETDLDADHEAWEQSHVTEMAREQARPYGYRFVAQGFLKTANGNSDNENFVLLLWKKINLAKDLEKRHLGVALVNVAATCCSINLAKYLIDAGASIDHRHRQYYLTPLHHAATHSTSEAAELMRFLLVLGANPATFATSSPKTGRKIRHIRDEAGAKGISKWLGMSWDELVEKTQAEVQK